MRQVAETQVPVSFQTALILLFSITLGTFRDWISGRINRWEARMRTRISVALIVVCLLAVTSIVVVNDLQNARKRSEQNQKLASGSVNLESITEPESPFLEDQPLTGQPEHALLEEGMQPDHLLHLIADSEAQPLLPLEAKVPTELPPADGLDPVPLLSPQRRKENAAIIKQVMPKITEDQLEFWLEETRDLPPEMIRNMLTIRQQFGGLTENFGQDRLDQKKGTESPRQSNIAPEKTEEDPILVSLRRARKLVQQNNLNYDSIGYLATELQFVEAYDDDVPAGVRLAKTSLSMKQEQYETTARLLDIALDPNYFLVVKEEGESRLTRYGSLKIGANRQLQLAINHLDLIIAGPITIPDEIVIVGIDERGRVMASEKQTDQNEEDWQELGKLEIVTVRDPSALKAVGNACYILTTESGPVSPVILKKQEKLLTPGALTKSNVDPQQQGWTLDRINGWIITREKQLKPAN
jgi:flagellar basal body rod protein FlgG